MLLHWSEPKETDVTIQGWLAAVREMPEEGAELGQNWADAQDVPGIVPPPTRLFLTLGVSRPRFFQGDVEGGCASHDHLPVVVVDLDAVEQLVRGALGARPL